MFFGRFNKFLKYFGQGYKKQLIKILFMSFMSSLLEFLGVVLVFPFIMILVNPNRVVNNPVAIYLEYHYNISGINNMILAIGFLIAGIIVIKNIYCIYITYHQNKLISEWGLDIKEKMLYFFLYSPYESDLQRGKLNIINTINDNIDKVMQYYIFKAISFISNTLVIVLIFSVLVFLLPAHTLIAIAFFAVAGSLQSGFFNRMANKLGTQKYKLTNGPYTSVINSLNCIKDIKVNGCQKFFYNFFHNISERMIPYNEKITLIPLIPQYIIEIIFIITMIILCFGILSKYGANPSNILISFGVVAIAIYRIVPQIYKNQMYLNYINIYTKNIDELFDTYDEYRKYEYSSNTDIVEKIAFNDAIHIRNLSYSYDKKNDVLQNINLDIKKGEFIGIVGLSGAGKSTLTDCILGLLNYDGKIYIDDKELNIENFAQFRNIVGYVPQKICTIEGDIYSNVAWGVERKDIDKETADKVLKQAQLYEQLKQTEYGLGLELKQDGSGLSGGQMQRIGIARALYRKPDIIVLDEATSNLDVKIENKLTKILSEIKGNKTIIAIAHRLSTLVNCDRIVYLKQGKLVDVGTFNELSLKYSDFEEIVKLSRIKLDDEQ